jgi:hypothetical protein
MERGKAALERAGAGNFLPRRLKRGWNQLPIDAVNEVLSDALSETRCVAFQRPCTPGRRGAVAASPNSRLRRVHSEAALAGLDSVWVREFGAGFMALSGYLLI